MRQSEQQLERLTGQPPKGRTQAHSIEQQRQCLSGHDEEGRERDRHDVRERAVEASLVEVIKGDRCKRDLHCEAGKDKS